MKKMLIVIAVILIAVGLSQLPAEEQRPSGPPGVGGQGAPDNPASAAAMGALDMTKTPPGSYVKLAVEITRSAITFGETVEVNFTLTNISKDKIEIIKPVLDVDALSFELMHMPDQGRGFTFVYTTITPSVYDHNKNKLERVMLDKFGMPTGAYRNTFSIPVLKQGKWCIKAVYNGAKQPINSEAVNFVALPPMGGAAAVAARSTNNELVAVLDTNKGKMVCRFFPDDAPNTVANFLQLARKGFYNNLIFHRVMKGFMIQGGCPDRNGGGSPGYNIKAEFNQHKHLKGVLSMARSKSNDSAGCQFFICHDAAPKLDNQYTVFGELIEGLDVLDKIAGTPVGPNPANPNEMSKPLEELLIKSVTIQARPVTDGKASETPSKPTDSTPKPSEPEPKKKSG